MQHGYAGIGAIDLGAVAGSDRGACRLRLALLSLVVAPWFLPDARADDASARAAGAAWLLQQQRGDGSWARTDGNLALTATTAALEALGRAGLPASPGFAAASGWLANAEADSIDSLARKSRALVAAGLSATAQREVDRLFGLRSEAASASWGGYGGNGLDVIDTALGLTALRTADAGYGAKLVAVSGNTILNAYCALLGARLSIAAGQRAWPAARGATGQPVASGRPSVIATALVLAESRAIEQRSGWASVNCGSGAITFTSVHDEARAWLLTQQNADGGFGEQRGDGSRGPSAVVVTAVVASGLAALASPPSQLTAARSWLLAQQGSAGDWRADPLVTALALSALPAASGSALTDTDRDGLTDVVETRLGTNPLVADATPPAGPPSPAVGGGTTIAFAAQGVVGQGFTYDLGSASGYALAAGSLPPGLALNPATGVIAGTPVQAGQWSFDFRAGAAGDLVIGRIDVAPAGAASGEGDVPLPPWAIGLLGSGLGFTLWRRARAARGSKGDRP